MGEASSVIYREPPEQEAALLCRQPEALPLLVQEVFPNPPNHVPTQRALRE